MNNGGCLSDSDSTSIDLLIGEAIQLKIDLLALFDNVQVVYDKRTGITPCGDYKLITDQKTLDYLKRRWNAWFKHVCKYSQDDSKVYQSVLAINQKINSNWRIHQGNIDSFKEQIESALCDMIDILEIEQKYEIKKRTDYISPEELTIQISANKLTINIHNLENFYTVVQKALNSTEIPEREKEELNLIIEEGLANPKDTGILKKVCTRLHAGFEKYSGELSAIGTVLSVFAPIIGV